MALFEITQNRALLMIFPNVFEYFFIFYEIVRLRWDPRRLSPSALAITAVNTIVSETLVRHGHSWSHALQHGLVMVAVNLPVFIFISFIRYGSIPALAMTNIIIFTLLLSLIIMLYDRYRPIYLVRFIAQFQL